MRLETTSHSDSEGSVSNFGVATSGSQYRVLPASDSPPPMCPFPPTAMVYSMRGHGKLQNISRLVVVTLFKALNLVFFSEFRPIN